MTAKSQQRPKAASGTTAKPKTKTTEDRPCGPQTREPAFDRHKRDLEKALRKPNNQRTDDQVQIKVPITSTPRPNKKRQPLSDKPVAFVVSEKDMAATLTEFEVDPSITRDVIAKLQHLTASSSLSVEEDVKRARAGRKRTFTNQELIERAALPGASNAKIRSNARTLLRRRHVPEDQIPQLIAPQLLPKSS